MKITIVLPTYIQKPIGGYHVHYQYANMFVEKGHDVTIVMAREVVPNWRANIPFFIWEAKTRLANRPLVTSFPLDDRVAVRLLPRLRPDLLPDADVLIATGWQTAEPLMTAPARKGRKYYVIYDYEYWMTSSDPTRKRIEDTFTGPFTLIATSIAVRRMLIQCGAEPAASIPCGLDFEEFGLDVPPADRMPLTLGFPARRESFKGCADAAAAAAILRERYGDRLTITAFGSEKPDVLGPSIQWLQFPSSQRLRQFYNENAVFLLPSHFEGWGLTGVEAMACGAALVVTDNGGSEDYAIDGQNALVVPPKHPEEIARAVGRLLDDDALRIRLALEGHRSVQKFNWPNAGNALNSLISQ